MSVLNYLSEIFKDWFGQKGEKTLDELLELNLSKGQKETFFKKLAREERDRQLCLDVARLNLLFRISIFDACGAVVARLNSEKSGGYKINFEDLKMVSQKTIYSIYFKNFKKVKSLPHFQKSTFERGEAGKTEFINKFPKKYLEDYLIPNYPDLINYVKLSPLSKQ